MANHTRQAEGAEIDQRPAESAAEYAEGRVLRDHAHVGGRGASAFPRHCERSEAIQVVPAEGFWIASLRSQ
ncbi:hypothetical protein AXW67_27170 [Bradyrhizobium neotropicale]|uniref:Uncharacterized protein n=1 Tax=Bradyrhizobium neotropicale TaxID=1497615 RepID=A0A176YNS2_9BRAD|nr:hypothetical protein AXW67_27170 [Bradyrhizobium neotropicale]